LNSRGGSEPKSRVVRRPALLIGGTAVALLLLALLAVCEHGFGEEALRSIVRGTARVAVTLFSLTFATSSLHAVRRSHATKWLLANRRYLGLSFALAHTDHLLSLLALGVCFPDPFVDDLDSATLIGGGIAYAFLFAMAATSTNAAFRMLGAGRWRALHTVGSYYIWLIFAFSYLPLASESAGAVAFAVILVIALLLRLARLFHESRKPG
jgi:sulfoxide reductase heme-binding subunit YedZ